VNGNSNEKNRNSGSGRYATCFATCARTIRYVRSCPKPSLQAGHPVNDSQITAGSYRLTRWSFWETGSCSLSLGASNLGLRGDKKSHAARFLYQTNVSRHGLISIRYISLLACRGREREGAGGNQTIASTRGS